MTRPLVLSSRGEPPSWAGRLEGAQALPPDDLPRALDAFDSVWIDAVDLQPLRAARAVAALDPMVQAVIVAPPDDLALHQRALLFTPGLGEVWFLAPPDVGPDARDRAREVTVKRRGYEQSRRAMGRVLEQFDGGRPRRAIVSDAYLAELLRVLPDPVISVDEEDRVVSWSPAAEDRLGVADGQALGRPVLDVLRPADPASFRSALERGREETSRLEVSLPGADGALVMEAVVTPVSTGGVEVRALVLRDVTRERESLARLEREVELRSRSYAAMSHEIRTPINAIMGYNELLRMGAVGEEKRVEYLDRTQKAAAHLLELVNDVLDLSKLESGALELQTERTPIREVIHELISTVEPLARERDTELEVECELELEDFFTDPRRLKQILINLMSNAIKFGEGRPVRVRCAATGSSVVFEVEDEGRGIDPSELARVFEEFVQVGDGQDGTGLGLPISRKLATLLGGDLTVESEPGVGSTFRLRLPLEPA